MPEYYFKIVPKVPLFKVFTYRYFQQLARGQKVKISFGRRKLSGMVLGPDLEASKLKNIKDILEVESHCPPLSEGRVCWLEWMSSYYFYPLGLLADLSFLKKPISKRKAVKSLKEESPPLLTPELKGMDYAQLEEELPPPLTPTVKTLKLTSDQEACVEKILTKPKFYVHLIHGVTGSGKTEVYKKLIENQFDQGQQVLVLLPEIFLTPQLVQRFSESFPGQTAVLHSQLTEKEKRITWENLLKSRKNLLVGTRSALFCPLPKLGLIIVDEEHDSSYKQEEKFRYQARDSSIVLAKELDIPLVLGSATPDFSSYQKALVGSYELYELKHRALKQKLPRVTVVDLKEESSQHGRPFWLSDLLFNKIEKTLKQDQQVALFVNRRGQATALICSSCGYTKQCLNCEISLTLHNNGYLLCHYCAYLEKKPSHCPSCKNSEWLEKGIGTQSVQKAIQRYFPDCITLRADRDTINSRQEMESFIGIVEKKEAQIIIGTQMISKGLNFPSIYLVGLILADMDFHLPDFRASERSFQTLLQMAGRAGRQGFGEVILQSFNPNHLSIHFAKEHDYKAFFFEEIKSRKKYMYPPFSRLCLLRIDSSKEREGQMYAEELAQATLKLSSSQIKILGPSPAPLFKIKNRYRFQILIKGANHQVLQNFLQNFLPKIQKKSFIQVKVDRDPLSML